MNISKHSLLILALALISAFLYIRFFENRASVDLDISVTQRTWFKIYWAENDQDFSEKNMARVRVKPGREEYKFFLTDIGKIDKLRIDPHQYTGSSTLSSLVISQNFFKPIVFNSPEEFQQLLPVLQVLKHDYNSDEGLTTLSHGKDPAYIAKITPEQQRTMVSYGYMLFRVAIIIGVFFALLYHADTFIYGTNFIPVVMAMIFVQVVIMASISQPKVHPDEHVHSAASEYYINNFLPPEIDSPEIQNTYSVYGASRLNSREISYFFIGQFAKLTASLQVPDYLRYRLFNVLLLGTIGLMVFYNKKARILALPFLFSPQIWYVFSYCNSDAFALTVSFFVCYQLICRYSTLNSYLTGNSTKTILPIFLLGVLGGMLFLLKKNFYVFILFVGGYVCWKLYFLINPELRIRFLKRLTVVIFIAAFLTAGRFGLDYYVNGPDRSAKIAEARVNYAQPLFNPDTPIDKKHVNLYRKSRGVDWKTLIFQDRWLEKTFLSSVGAYGYLSVVPSDNYLDAYRWTGLFFLFLLIVFITARGRIHLSILLSFFLMCSIGLIFISFWHSWTSDFQPQGRYLLPIIPMLSILLYHVRKVLPAYFITISAMVLFLLSSYSFIYMGLWQIPKVSGI